MLVFGTPSNAVYVDSSRRAVGKRAKPQGVDSQRQEWQGRSVAFAIRSTLE